MGQVDEAAKAYRAAQAALDAAKTAAEVRIKAARDKAVQARTRLADAIVAEAQAGTPQVEIIRASGYSRERVRTILRDGGVEPD